MHVQQEHYKRVMKSFNVAQLGEMLRAKGKPVKGRKEDKAQQVAWTYTVEEIDQWVQKENPLTRPAIMDSVREAGQTSLDNFFPVVQN